jgi:GT2 family glycosyltransferase
VTLAARCAVVIPTVAAGAPLLAALEALGPVWRAATVVVDNGAPVAAMADVRRRFPEPDVLATGANLGFAAAVNRGVARAPGADVVVVLNDDVVVPPAALESLVQALLGDEAAGSAAGVLLQAGSDRIDTAGVRCDAALGSRDVGRGLTVADLGGAPAPLGPSGGLAAYRRDALTAAGGFDAGFFAYYEDVDLALRLQQAGWTCALATGAVGEHLGSATLGWRSAEKAVLVARSRGRIARKYGAHRRPRAWPALALELAAGAALSAELRSMAPLRARVAGFAAAATERPYPAALVDRGTRGGIARRLARRYARSAVATGT